jgi:hypothetical protein
MLRQHAHEGSSTRRPNYLTALFVGLLAFEVFLYFGTALKRITFRDFRKGGPGETCLIDRPVAYECLLPTLCRSPASCIKPTGSPYLCCASPIE